MTDFRTKDNGAPTSETRRTRQLATFNGHDVSECICNIQLRDRDGLRWWDYQKTNGDKFAEPHPKRYMWIPAQSCACHGSGWVCAICGGAGWVRLQEYGKPELCPQCRDEANGGPDWARSLAELRGAAEQVEMEEVAA